MLSRLPGRTGPLVGLVVLLMRHHRFAHALSAAPQESPRPQEQANEQLGGFFARKREHDPKIRKSGIIDNDNQVSFLTRTRQTVDTKFQDGEADQQEHFQEHQQDHFQQEQDDEAFLFQEKDSSFLQETETDHAPPVLQRVGTKSFHGSAGVDEKDKQSISSTRADGLPDKMLMVL